MRIVFFGSDDFAATHLEALLKSSHAIVLCVTKPDTRQGRGMHMAISPIKVLANAQGIDCIQPDTLKDPSVEARLKGTKADCFVVVAYGMILTQAILDIPKLFCVNVHGSLLPQYRGAAPINWAILNGDKVTGVTVQKMALGLDAGDVIAQTKVNITPEMMADVLRAHMAESGATLLVDTLSRIEEGKHTLTPQDPSKVTYAPKLTKAMGQIDWNAPAQKIYDLIRGLKPWPGTHTLFKGKTLKVLNAFVTEGMGEPGKVIAVGKDGFTIACGSGALLIRDVQPEAGKAMPAVSFVAGYRLDVGIHLG